MGIIKDADLEGAEIVTDRELAKLLFKGALWSPTSWKTVQRMAREGLIRGQKVGRGGWVFHKDAVRDFLMRPRR